MTVELTIVSVHYQPDERPPTALASGLGLQLAVLIIAFSIFIPTTVIRAAGETESYLLSWAVFTAIVLGGAVTVLQAVRLGRVGAGYALVMTGSPVFIAVCITAIAEGGPAMLATLVVISSLFQFALSARLSLFRRILTPTVTGTVIMLIPVTVMTTVFDMLTDVPDGRSVLAAPLSAFVTILVIAAITLKATGTLRLWAPIIGVVTGSVTAGFFGLYDVDLVVEASWIGFPMGGWPGFGLDFGPVFWALLPAFVLAALIDTILMISNSLAIQRVSWRRPRAVDFRSVQGTVAAAGIGNLLCGLAGTVPNTTAPSSVSVTELTGVAARNVGIVAGAAFIALAFLPKAFAVVLAVPNPVVAAYLTVLMAMLFVAGMRMVLQDGIDYREGLIAGVAFWAGVGFQNDVIFPEYVSELAGGLLRNGMTAGGLVAILMTLFVGLTRPRPSRIEVELDLSAWPKIRAFLSAFVSRSGWNAATANRLVAVSEETFLTLLRQDEGENDHDRRRLLLVVHKEDGGAVVEFFASTGENNLQDQLALLGDQPAEASIEREVSLRLLRHLASSVRHQQYHDADIVTVRVEAPGPTGGGRT